MCFLCYNLNIQADWPFHTPQISHCMPSINFTDFSRMLIWLQGTCNGLAEKNLMLMHAYYIRLKNYKFLAFYPYDLLLS